MKLLFDFFPILLFFICYKLFDIYYATAVAMGASLLQVIFYRIKNQRYEKMHLISLGLIMVLGGATLFFHNPWFIKWKPTGLYWLAAIVFLSSSFIGKKNTYRKNDGWKHSFASKDLAAVKLCLVSILYPHGVFKFICCLLF